MLAALVVCCATVGPSADSPPGRDYKKPGAAAVRHEGDLLTSDQVAARRNVSVRTLWRLVAAGNFPQPIRFNRKLVRWKTVEVDAYVESLGRRFH
jgi:predicted DNA-binding transcriptional regulator AlpA